jgi:hypothetical protein
MHQLLIVSPRFAWAVIAEKTKIRNENVPRRVENCIVNQLSKRRTGQMAWALQATPLQNAPHPTFIVPQSVPKISEKVVRHLA